MKILIRSTTHNINPSFLAAKPDTPQMNVVLAVRQQWCPHSQTLKYKICKVHLKETKEKTDVEKRLRQKGNADHTGRHGSRNLQTRWQHYTKQKHDNKNQNPEYKLSLRILNKAESNESRQLVTSLSVVSERMCHMP